ncbi:hypothetical protein BGZ96_007121 [Linnemannia gamsii]|uniref:Ser-Thr-rich glycosyl-phosphatidyl-inositol-anchored membrane family-domain-containing protein n=1 Tax=Linnemannia gamsii TaxID=64522 RepID=A0ABQ7K0X2_9FUNG|nr:hypothetical protein BGZ96_007121 [Linnemannia gamsii]
MKSIAIVALSTLALASQVAAQILSYSAPIAATQWTAGKPATISWTNSCGPVDGNTTFPVTLNQQVGLYQVQVPGIPELGYLDCKKPGKITIQVPATIPQGNAYSILVTNGNQSYSALFTILSTIPGSTTVPLPTTTVAPVTTAPTTSVAPITTTSSTTPSTTPNKPNHAGALKVGSQAALVVVAAVASLLL